MAQIDIIYGTVSGNTEVVVQKVAEILSEQGHEVSLHRAKTAQISDLAPNSTIILASPTYGHGQLEAYMAQFTGSLPPKTFENRHAAVIGLGDNKYDDDFLIESAPILEHVLGEQGAKIAIESLKIAKEPWNQMETRVKNWALKLSTTLSELA